MKKCSPNRTFSCHEATKDRCLSIRACLQLGHIRGGTDQNQTRNSVLLRVFW
jgi:hypothetical protein